MKIRLVGAELLHVDRGTDGQTDTTKLTVAFHIFVNVPKKGLSHKIWNFSLVAL